jgi:hypothetical protein
MLADELDYVLGVDTHRDEHVMAVVTAPAGAVVAGSAAPTNGRGYRGLLRVAERHAPGRRAWAIEGTGSYGAGLARFLAGRGETVLELSRTPRAERRLRGKDDELDAARTARAALASETLVLPRAGEQREALRLLLVARRSAVDVRREALTQLRAVIVTAPEASPAASGLPRSRLPSSSRRSSPCARTRPGAARRTGRRTDRRRPADRRLVTPRSAALGSLLRPPRRRRPGARLERVGAGNSDLGGHPLADGVRGQLSRQPRDHRPRTRREKDPAQRPLHPVMPARGSARIEIAADSVGEAAEEVRGGGAKTPMSG